jgi:hypothetical protein
MTPKWTSDPNNLRSGRNPVRTGCERCERLARFRRVANILTTPAVPQAKLSLASEYMGSA